MISFNSSISALQSLDTRQAVSANDVANVNTKGYEESQVIQTDLSNNSGTRISEINKIANSNQEISGTRLEVEIPEQMMIQSSYTANASVIKTQDQMTGSLLDIVG